MFGLRIPRPSVVPLSLSATLSFSSLIVEELKRRQPGFAYVITPETTSIFLSSLLVLVAFTTWTFVISVATFLFLVLRTAMPLLAPHLGCSIDVESLRLLLFALYAAFLLLGVSSTPPSSKLDYSKLHYSTPKPSSSKTEPSRDKFAPTSPDYSPHAVQYSEPTTPNYPPTATFSDDAASMVAPTYKKGLAVLFCSGDKKNQLRLRRRGPESRAA